MANNTTSSRTTGEPETQTETKRPLMPLKLLHAAINGNEADLKRLLGLNNGEQDHPPHTRVSIEEMTTIEPSDCLIRSAAGMENTILHILSANNHENLVSAICMKDSSLLKARNVRNETPFHHAARYGHVNTILRLMANAKLEFGKAGLKELLRQKNCLGETTLHEATRHGHGAVVYILMREDLELAGLVNNDFVSPLYLATARGSLYMVENMVEIMLDQEITPAFYSGPKKQTALHAAVLQDQEITKNLLQLYSEPLGKGADETGKTPLHFVASTGKLHMAELLLDKDPSLAYIQDSDGSFPVHTAARMGHVKMITLFLERCPDSGQLLDVNGRNFLHIAIEANKLNVFFPTPPRWFIIMLNIITIVVFSRFINTTDYLELVGRPTSHWKKMFNNMVNTMDNKGNTPLHLAAEHGYINFMVSFLKTNNLDQTLKNKEGLTALDISLIQQSKSATNTKSRDLLGAFYHGNEGARFSTGLFQYYTKGQMSEKDTIQEHISTTDSTGAKKSSERVMAKAQLVGLGSVLIATVTFAAAFTLPGGTNQDTPHRKSNIRVFFLANYCAFFLSFLSTMLLIYSSSEENSDRMEMHVAKSMTLFTMAAKCMVIALIYGMYLVLGPDYKTTKIIIAEVSVFLLVFDNRNGFSKFFRNHSLRLRLLDYIPEEVGVKLTPIRIAKEISYCYDIFLRILAPVIFSVVFTHL